MIPPTIAPWIASDMRPSLAPYHRIGELGMLTAGGLIFSWAFIVKRDRSSTPKWLACSLLLRVSQYDQPFRSEAPGWFSRAAASRSPAQQHGSDALSSSI